MKAKFTFIALLLIVALTACQEDDVVYNISEDNFQPIVDRFYAEAAERGYEFKQNNLLIETLPKNSNQLIDGRIEDNGQRVMSYNRMLFTEETFEPLFGQIEVSIYSVLWSLHNQTTKGLIVSKVQTGDPSTLSDEEIDRLFDMFDGTFVDDEE